MKQLAIFHAEKFERDGKSEHLLIAYRISIDIYKSYEAYTAACKEHGIITCISKETWLFNTEG